MLGICISLIVVLFIFLIVLYRLFKKEIDPYVAQNKMPILQPVPIPTKNRKLLMRILVWFFDIRKWIVVENWSFVLENGNEITIPKNFVFDGASIPRLFWFLLSPVGLLLIPGLIHDYGYKYNQLWQKDESVGYIPYMPEAGKKKWDDLFKFVALEVNGFSFINSIAWLGVKFGGYFAWKKHRRENKKPEPPFDISK
jgi:hypothetical protein